MKMKQLGKKYGVDFGKDKEMSLTDFLKKKGYSSLARMISESSWCCKKGNYWLCPECGKEQDECRPETEGHCDDCVEMFEGSLK